jgi:hypothetical protein
MSCAKKEARVEFFEWDNFMVDDVQINGTGKANGFLKA